MELKPGDFVVRGKDWEASTKSDLFEGNKGMVVSKLKHKRDLYRVKWSYSDNTYTYSYIHDSDTQEIELLFRPIKTESIQKREDRMEEGLELLIDIIEDPKLCFSTMIKTALTNILLFDDTKKIKILDLILDNPVQTYKTEIATLISDLKLMILDKDFYDMILETSRIETFNENIKNLDYNSSRENMTIEKQEQYEFNEIAKKFAERFFFIRKYEKFNRDEDICPITQEEIKNPIMLKCGHFFEEEAIMKYAGSSRDSKCPCCRVNLEFISL